MFLPLSVATKGINCDKSGERYENVSYLVLLGVRSSQLSLYELGRRHSCLHAKNFLEIGAGGEAALSGDGIVRPVGMLCQ